MDDAAAIRQCREGDRFAFRHLVERYQHEAMGHALAILRNRPDAEDAVQDAFIAAYRALGQFDERRRFYPWFYTILRHRCLKLADSQRRMQGAPLNEVEMLTRQAAPSIENTLALEDALSQLPPASRELLLLRHLDGLTYQELADRLGLPLGTVMSRLFSARKQLRERFTARFQETKP